MDELLKEKPILLEEREIIYSAERTGEFESTLDRVHKAIESEREKTNNQMKVDLDPDDFLKDVDDKFYGTSSGFKFKSSF